MKAAGIARQTVGSWIAQGLLPAPTKVSQGTQGGVFNRFPAWAVERARFIAQRRAAGFTVDEVRVMLAELDARQGLPRLPAAPSKDKGRGGRRK